MPKRARSPDSAMQDSHTPTPQSPAESSSSAITAEKSERVLQVPQKRFYRQRAHANVFVDHLLDYPSEPSRMDWSTHYPKYLSSTTPNSGGQLSRPVEFADVGCGFGGLLMALAPQFPDTLMLGMEIRISVTQYVHDRIQAFRQHQSRMLDNGSSTLVESPLSTTPTASSLDPKTAKKMQEEDHLADIKPPPYRVPGQYQNVSVIRANAMKHLPNFFEKGQLTKLFFLFPDPHFKRSKHKARIVTTTLLAEYAYVLKVGGILYTVTDVKDLHDWMMLHLRRHPLFEYIPTQALLDDKDPVLHAAMTSTEEGKKVARNQGEKWAGCFRRIEPPGRVTPSGGEDGLSVERKIVRREA